MFKSNRMALDLVAKEDRRSFFILFVLIVISTALEAVSIGLVLPLIAAITSPDQIPEMTWLSIFNYDSLGSQKAVITLLGLLLIGVFIIKNVVILGSSYYRNHVIRNAEAEASRRLLGGYVSMPFNELAGYNSSDVVRTLNEALPSVFGAYLLSLLQLISELLVVLVITALLIKISPLITLQVILIVGVMIATVHFALRTRYYKWSQIKLELLQKRILWQNQSLGAEKELRVLGRRHIFNDVYSDILKRLARVLVLSSTAAEIPRLFLELVMLTALVFVVIIPFASAGQLGQIMPTLAAFAAAGLRLMPSANRILSCLQNMKSALPSVERVHRDWLRYAKDKLNSPGEAGLIRFKKSFFVEEISFTYSGRNEEALKNISIKICAGDTVGIVGQSGAGKSTLIDIVLGVLKPSQGRLVMDGVDISLDTRPWQQSVGYVPQNVYLIDDTIQRNIALGIPDSAIDTQRVETAIKKAQLSSLVEALPNKLETVVGENGVLISGGQRQRIGIARALYHDPPVLVFDEATSALDNETTAEIQEAISLHKNAKTILVIAHRLSSVRACNRLIVLKDGEIIGDGTYEILSETCSHFERLVRLDKF